MSAVGRYLIVPPRVDRRRALLRTLALLAVSLGPVCVAGAAGGQRPSGPRRIGILLMSFSPNSKETSEFRRGLSDVGYLEGRDVELEWRVAKGDYERLPTLARELVESEVDLIVVDGTPGALAAKGATSTIPIVMTIVADPVGSGLVTNLARPGGNITGLSLMSSDIWAKRMQLLRETIPGVTRVTVLGNPKVQWYARAVEAVRLVAPSMSIQISLVPVRAADELAPALAAVTRGRAQAVYVLTDPLLILHRAELLKLITEIKLPAIFSERRFVDDGGLMSYGPNWAEAWRRAAGYVDRIFKGVKPGDLPIEQPTKLELVFNLKAAKAIGLKVPQSVLLRADEVIR